MQNKQKKIAGMHGNRTINMLVLVLYTKLWLSQTSCVEYIPPIQPLRCTTVWNPSKLPCPSSLEALFLLHMFLAFFGTLYKQLCNLYDTYELSISKWKIKLNKRNENFYLNFNLSYIVILSNPHNKSVVNLITVRFFFARQICKIINSLILIN